MRCTDTASINGLMKGDTKACGTTHRCMEKGRCSGQMVDGIEENTAWTRSKVKVLSLGVMDAAIVESGTTGSSMVREYSRFKPEMKGEANGSMEKESGG